MRFSSRAASASYPPAPDGMSLSTPYMENMERAVALPTSTDVPCMHCAEPFSTPPVVLLRPHYDDQNKYKPRQMFEGCFCSGPCMLAYYDECGTNSMMLAWAHASCDALKLPLPQEAGPKALQMRGRGGSHAPVRTALTVPTAEALAAIQAIPCPVAVQRMTVDQEVRSHERYTAGCSPTGARLLTDEGHAALDALGVPREASGPCTHCAEAIPDGQRPVVLLRRADIHDTSTKPRRVSRWAHDGTFCSGSCLLGFYAQRVDEETYDDTAARAAALETSLTAHQAELRRLKGLLMERGVPDGLICPLSLEIYEDPVMAADGFSYERREIENWFARGKRTSPKTNEELPHTFLMPNRDLKSTCQDFLDDVRKFEAC